jgi:hypothetical protein
MRPARYLATLAIALSASGLAALTLDRGTPQFTAIPARAHVALGPIAVLAPGEAEAVPLATAARARYGRVDGLVAVRHVPLPGSDRGMITATAIRWN